MSGKKWLSPVERILESEKFGNISDYVNEVESNKIYFVHPSKIIRWEGKDRPENELGNLEDLAKSMREVGQQVPCIVRPVKKGNYDYELIVGERRWRASQIADIELKVLISKVDDREASIIQAIENEQRNNLSDYAIGMSYFKKIEQGFLSQTDLIEILGKTKQEISRLLSFSKIPNSINVAIEDFRNISARTASEIRRLANKSKANEEIIIENAQKIREGKIGHTGLLKLINKVLAEDSYYTEKAYSNDGNHILTWKSENNSKSILFNPSFSKNLRKDEFEKLINKVIKYVSK